ncbi:MAG: MFS transporter [Paludibacter sp.]|nr:MFS transporter [Paludibacter sp.]
MKGVLKDRRLYVIFSITVVSVMGVASLTPAFPKMSEVLHLSRVEVGWLISAFTFPGIFLTPFAGIIADRWGRKTVLVPSLIIFAVSGFSLFFVHKFEWMVALRFLQGVGAASLGSINGTLIGDFFKGPQRPEAMGYNAGVLSFFTALYPLVGGALAGFSWYFPFLLPLLAIPVALFLIFGIEEPSIDNPTDFKSYFKSMADAMLKKNVIAIFVLSILTFVILYGALITYIPFLMKQKFNLSAPMIGVVISLSSVASVIVSTRVGALTKKYGSANLLKVAFILYAVANVLFPMFNHLFLFIIPVLFFGVAQALNMPSLQTLLLNIAPENLRGAFMSINGMSLRIGQTIGPFIVGVGYALGGVYGAYFLAAAIALVGLVLTFTAIAKVDVKK